MGDIRRIDVAGCSNHGCWIETKLVGTNGWCHCLEKLGREDAIALKRRINDLQAVVSAAMDALWEGEWADNWARDELIKAIKRVDSNYNPWEEREKPQCTQ